MWELLNDDTTLATVSSVQLDNGSMDSNNENEGLAPDLPIFGAPLIPPEPLDTIQSAAHKGDAAFNVMPHMIDLSLS
eukprot:1762689-Ditylum_brightwellii.AAC.1